MKRKFGTIAGREVFLYTLINSSGAEVSICNYGGMVTSIKVPGDTGILEDMVLGFDRSRNIYNKYTGICLEAQHFPDSPNRSGFPTVILCPGEVYRQTTRYLFTTL